MAIIQQPSSLSLLGNLPPFEITGSSPVNFTLKDGSTILASEVYQPSPAGNVIIDVRQLIEGRLTFAVKTDNLYEQTGIAKTFTAVIDGQTITFKVLRAGVANLADTVNNFLKGNFLTWQPTSKEVSYSSPEWLTYYAVEAGTLKLKAYFDDGTSTTYTIGTLTAGKAYTANMQYSHRAGIMSKYPTHYDVWAESTTGTPLTYTQRYLYSLQKSELEQWVLFENSLGGIDTVRTSGATELSGEHTYNTSTVDGISTEFRIDTHRNYTQHTGALDTYERRWLLDLFPARHKYVHHAGAIRPIVLTADTSKYSTDDLPSSYSFTFRFADDSRGLLNLIRNAADIPAEITLPNLSAPNFTIPPRLSEFPRVPLSEGVILPAFDPNSDTPTVTTIGQIIAAAVAEALLQIPGGDGTPGTGGQLVNIVRKDSLSSGTDNDVFSSLRTKKEIDTAIQAFADDIDNYLDTLDEKFLSKVNLDVAQSIIKFLDGAQFGDFVAGMHAGRGAAIDNKGNAEVESLKARGAIEAPEYIFNKLTVVGDEIIFSENGTIQSVEHIEGDVYKANMRLQEGELIGFKQHDLIKGIYHHAGGFASSFMIVDEVAETFMKLTLAAPEDTPTNSNLPPKDFMKVAHVGNAVDPERQRYIVASSKSGGIQVYDGASTFLNGTLVGSMDAAQSFEDMYGELPLRPGLFYLYAAGLIVQDIVRIDYKGVPVREVYDRGPWQAGHTYYNNNENGTDDVWHLGCRWRCFSDNTTDEPGWTSQHWVMIEGRSDARMEFDSSGGLAFFSGRVNTTITPIVMIGNTDVSADIVPEQWSWSRETGDEDADLIWQAKNKERRIITLKNEDMGPNWSRLNPTRFTCTAIYPASSINKVESYINI